MLMHNADKGGGAGGSQKPPTVPELTQRVKDLETENQTLTTQLGEANTAKDVAIAAQQKAEGERDASNTAKDTAIAAQQKAEGERDAANTAKQGVETELTTTKQTLDTTKTDLRLLKEESAKNGGTAPTKQPGAGDHTVTDKPEDKSKSPRERLAAGFKIQGADQAK